LWRCSKSSARTPLRTLSSVALGAGICRFLVFPRGGRDEASEVKIPAAWRGRATVVEAYVDPQVLSSTAIREALARGGKAEGEAPGGALSPSMLHPALRGEASRLYQADAAAARPPERRTCFVHLLGGPGSGKSSLGDALRKLGFRHISGGSVYRAANARSSSGGWKRQEGQAQVVAKVFGAISHVVTSWHEPQLASFDSFLPKDFVEFEARVGPLALVVELHCSEGETLRRLSARQARGHDIERAAEERVQLYHSAKQRSIRNEMLKSFDGGRGVVRSLDAERPFEEVLVELVEMVRQAASACGVDPLLPLATTAEEEEGGGPIPERLDEAFWDEALQKLEASPKQSYNARKNAATVRQRGGARALKNFNNLVKTVLIDWSLAVVVASSGAGGEAAASDPASEGPCVEVLDVASGRGGDQIKFVQSCQAQGVRLCYNGIDVADEQVAEAQRRLRLTCEKDGRCRSTLCRARLFVGDVVRVPLPELASQQVVSIQFAIQYAFGTEANARSFLKHSLERLCTGGVFIAVTLDSEKIRELSADAILGPDLVVQNSLYRVTFEDRDIASSASAGDGGFGLKYHFALSGEGIGCDEYVVTERELAHLLDELGVDLVASIPFSQLLDSVGHAPKASVIAAALRESLGGIGASAVPSQPQYDIYDRLGLRLARDESEVARLYKAYAGRRRPPSPGADDGAVATPRPDVAGSVAEATASVCAGARLCGDILVEGGEPLRLDC